MANTAGPMLSETETAMVISITCLPAYMSPSACRNLNVALHDLELLLTELYGHCRLRSFATTFSGRLQVTLGSEYSERSPESRSQTRASFDDFDKLPAAVVSTRRLSRVSCIAGMSLGRFKRRTLFSRVRPHRYRRRHAPD